MLSEEAIKNLPSPCFVIEEEKLEKNLELLSALKGRTGCKILLSLKAFAMWRLAPLIRRHLDGVNAASLNEARLGIEEFKGEVHLTSPGLSDADFNDLFALIQDKNPPAPVHVAFNSLNQWRRHGRECLARGVVCGLRVNPGESVVEVPIYDPCCPGSRLGVLASELAACPSSELAGITGLHFHALCEQNAGDLERALSAFEKNFGGFLDRMEWVNFGGGHHITRLRRLHPELEIEEEYELERLERLILDFQRRHPLKIYLEPGEAVAYGAGYLAATVLDLLERGVWTAALDVSAAAHMPDTLEGPYQPPALGAQSLGKTCPAAPGPRVYRLTGNSCLAGDVMGFYEFALPLEIGDRIVFLDQAHYTMVKQNTFNGVRTPAILLLKKGGEMEAVREFGYADFRDRLS